MNLQENIRRIKEVMFLNENENVDNKVKDIILNAEDWDDFINALEVKFGDTVPLYHATTKEVSKIIDREGYKLTYGKNYKSFAKEPLIYFQIGHSDYQSSNRPVVYRVDVPIDFFRFVDIDMDSVNTSDEDLINAGVDMESWNDWFFSDIKDVIKYFVWNNMTLDGMELLITDRDDEGDIFKGLIPVKVSELNEE